MELCARAVERGLGGLCFTEHLDFNTELPEYGFYRYDHATAAIAEARDHYQTRLDIRMGLEVEYDIRFEKQIRAVVPLLSVDFVLGSVHEYRGVHFANYVRQGRHHMTAEELTALYREYGQTTRAMIRTGIFDCIGHLDYPAKRGIRRRDGQPAENYDEEMTSILTLAVAHGVGIEINTKHVVDGAPLAPPASVVQTYSTLGGRLVTLGSDTHGAEELGEGLEAGLTVLHQLGIPPVIYRRRQVEFFTDTGKPLAV